MKKALTLLALLALPLMGSAQSDTITVTQYKALNPVVARTPFMADSINVQGKKYDLKGQLSLRSPLSAWIILTSLSSLRTLKGISSATLLWQMERRAFKAIISLW